MTDTQNTSESRLKKMLKAVGIYAIGNIGSKIITFLMIPLYTFYVRPDDYGYYDLCLSAVLFLCPLISLQLREGSFRFLIDSDDPRRHSSVITESFRALAISVSAFFALALALSLFTDIAYLWWTFALLVMMMLQELVAQMTRGLGRSTVFVTANIISAFLIGALSLLFVVWSRMGIKGIFLANILARLISILYIEARMRLFTRHLSFRLGNNKLLRQLLAYSLPLLPGGICYWVLSCSDRFFIKHFLTLADNGIYAVAARFVNLIYVVFVIFYQAWQETALRQYKSNDRDKFFSDIFNAFIYVMSLILVAFSIGMKLVYPWLVAQEYRSSLDFIYPLGLAMTVFTIAATLEIVYQCAYETMRILPAIIAASAINIICNLALVPLLGIYGAILTAFISYTILLIWRLHDMKRYIRLRIYPRSALPVAIAIAAALPFYFCDSAVSTVASLAVIVSLFLLIVPPTVKAKVIARLHRHRTQN